MGGRSPPPKVFQGPTWTGQGFLAIFQQLSPVLGRSHGVVPHTHPNQPPPPHIPHGLGPHGPRTFTHDRCGVGWVFVGVSWGQLGSVGCQLVRGQISTLFGDRDPRRVTMFPPQDEAENIRSGPNQGQKWIQHPQKRGTPCGHSWLPVA